MIPLAPASKLRMRVVFGLRLLLLRFEVTVGRLVRTKVLCREGDRAELVLRR
jgi:hypothetical protein